MTVKIKVPVKDIEKIDIYSQVEEALKRDRDHAYTIGGLMIDVFNVKKEDFENKPFSLWKGNSATLYSRITRCLKRLEKVGKIKSAKHGKAFVYWYIGEDNKYNIRLKEKE